MDDQINDILTIVEDEVSWLKNAGHHFEELASRFSAKEKAKWALVTAVYRERAEMHQELLENLRAVRLAKLGIRNSRIVDSGAEK